MKQNLDPDCFAARLLEIVAGIEAKKLDDGVMPNYATIDEVFNALKDEISESLREQCRQKRLRWHKTVNGIIMFETINHKKITI